MRPGHALQSGPSVGETLSLLLDGFLARPLQKVRVAEFRFDLADFGQQLALLLCQPAAFRLDIDDAGKRDAAGSSRAP